jgi:hypothetical protein
MAFSTGVESFHITINYRHLNPQIKFCTPLTQQHDLVQRRAVQPVAQAGQVDVQV